jgi:hypothetical protein
MDERMTEKSLVERGVLEEERRRRLGLFETTRYIGAAVGSAATMAAVIAASAATTTATVDGSC